MPSSRPSLSIFAYCKQSKLDSVKDWEQGYCIFFFFFQNKMHDPILPKKFNSKYLCVDPMYCNARNEASQLSLLCDNKGLSKKFSGKELPYFFDQTMHVSVWRHFFHWKARRDQWRLDKVYVQTIQWWLLDAGSSTRNLSVLLSAMEKSCATRTALALARNHCQNYSHVRVPHVAVATGV